MAGAGSAGGAWIVIRRHQPALRATSTRKAHSGGGGARARGGDRLRVAPRRRSGLARSQRAEENSDADAALTWGGRGRLRPPLLRPWHLRSGRRRRRCGLLAGAALKLVEHAAALA